MNIFSRKFKIAGKNASLVLILLVCLLGANVFLARPELLSQIETLKTNSNWLRNYLEELKNKEVMVSSKELEQADTLAIKIRTDSPSSPAGELGNEKISFLKISDGWLGILGIDVKEKSGDYDLVLKLPDGRKFEDKAEIKERDFPGKKLLLTNELIEKGFTYSKISQNISKENSVISKITGVYRDKAYFDGPFNYPLAKMEINGNYGDIREENGLKLQHLGVDLVAQSNTPVYTVNDGVVRLTENFENYGKTVIIDHGLGIYSFYLHLNKFRVNSGEKVKKGEIIGLSGGTGYAIIPHLHFSIKIQGKSVDPLRFIETVNEMM